MVELAEIAGVVTAAVLCETFQSIRSSSSSFRSNVGSDRPLGFAFMPCAHGSTVTSDVLPLQSIDGVADVVAAVFVDVVTVGDEVVAGAEVRAAVEVVFAVDVVEVEVDDAPDVIVLLVVVVLSTAVPPWLPACGSRGPPC